MEKELYIAYTLILDQIVNDESHSQIEYAELKDKTAAEEIASCLAKSKESIIKILGDDLHKECNTVRVVIEWDDDEDVDELISYSVSI